MAVTFRVTDYTHTYPAADGAAGPVALDGVSVDVPAGGTVAVLGPSGCGKSTLLNVLGLLWEAPVPRGKVVYHDGPETVDYADLNRAGKTALRQRAFGFVLQSCYLLPHLTCLENVALPLALAGWPPADRERWAEVVLAAADPRGDLVANRHKPPRQVSLGQRQRMAAVRAVVADPRVVFADEPTSNLDPHTAAAVLGLLDEWRSGDLVRRVAAGLPAAARRVGDPGRENPRTLLLVCHSVETARARADHVRLFDGTHRAAAAFPRGGWDAHAGAVARVLNPPEVDPGCPPPA